MTGGIGMNNQTDYSTVFLSEKENLNLLEYPITK